MRNTSRSLLLAALTAFGITFLSYSSFTAIAQFIGPGNCAAGMCSGSIAVDSNGDVGFGASATTTARLYLVASTTAGSYAIEASGTIYSAAGGFKFPDGTTQTTAAAAGGGTVSTTAENVKAGAFGANWSGGNYSFPGKVGIGTNGPAGILDVRQNTTGLARHYFINTNTAAYQQTDIDIGRATAAADLYLGTNYGTAQNAFIDNRSGGKLLIKNNGADTITVDANGNVGIGTTGPFAPLTVHTSSGQNLGLRGDLSGKPQIYSVNDANSAYQDLKIDAASLLLNYNSGGNVGIGTASPGQTLEVASADNTYIKIGNTTANTSGLITGLEFWPISNLTRGPKIQVISGLSPTTASAYTSGFKFVTENYNGSAFAAVDAVVIGASGNVGIGNTSPSYKLDVVSAGATTARFGTASGDKVVVGGGSGKIDVGTVDPIYTIGGKQYSTYLPGMTGQNEETAGHVECSISNNQCAYTIDFKNLKEGTGLWLFSKATDLAKHFGDLTVLLTPAFDGKVWYEEDAKNLRIVIHAVSSSTSKLQTPTSLKVSYRLTAPRFDAAKWTNDSNAGYEGFNLDKLGIN